MKGDFTRFSHQPHRQYAGVLMQQGRVTLDADWNEQFDIDDHRRRVQTVDTVGSACAPVGAAGFGISFTPDGTDLIINPGRIYVEGLLVELPPGTAVGVDGVEGTTAAVRHLHPDGRPLEEGHWVEVSSDATDAGEREPALTRVTAVDPGTSAVEVADDVSAFGGDSGVVLRRVTTYLTQPYFPAAAPPPFGDPFHPEDWAGSTHLLYLDVWRRHVTAIEDPSIREVALGGPDTATRVQTVWALRILGDPEREDEPADASGISCTDDLPAWDALVAPPAGRLSARAEAAPAEDDPCAIQPEAGYRGLENRLYRVEIHEPGDRGTATFKWSRDNGSILSSIVGFADVDEIDVHSLGRDKVLRFRADDRVEVLSDESELSGRTGTMASIVGAPDEAQRRISLDTDVSVHEPHTRPRIRRWDHGGAELTTAPGWVELEHGVQVAFGEGPFRGGDHWVVPARVATGDVEGFVDAPPRGVDHHFARLALVTWPDDAAGDILDCRRTFPTLCGLERGGGDRCCTVSVGEEGDVRSLGEAVDAVAQIAGPVRICVLAGEHRLPGTVVVTRSDLTIAGCGRTSRLVALQGGALHFQGGRRLRVQDLTVLSTSAAPTVSADGVETLEIVDCDVVNGGRLQPGPADSFTAVTRPAEVERARREGDAFAARHEGITDLGADPFMAASFVVAVSRGPAIGTSVSTAVAVRDCRLRGTPAVTLQGDYLRVERNLVTGGGLWLRDGSEQVEVSGNTITRGHGAGVLLGGLADGEEPRGDRFGVARTVLRANRIEAMTREGVSSIVLEQDVTGDVDDLTIEGNEILRCGLAPMAEEVAVGGGILLRDGSGIRILHNRLEDNGPAQSLQGRLVIGFGVAVFTSSGLDVHGNAITDNGPPAGPDREPVVLNVGVAAIGVHGTAGGAGGLDAVAGRDAVAERGARSGPAASIRDNVVVTPDGPSVVVGGVGPIAVNDNTLVSRYLDRSLLDLGRAVLVLDLGAAPDVGLDPQGEIEWPLLDGRTEIHDNQITVQAPAFGLPPRDPDVDPFEAGIGDLVTGSAVAAVSFDDVSVSGNQVLNEVPSTEESLGSIRSSVFVRGTTVRSTGNRVTESRGTALLSYAGTALAHNASDNTTTHCMRVEGSSVVERDNQMLFCFRLRPVLDFVHFVFGGAR